MRKKKDSFISKFASKNSIWFVGIFMAIVNMWLVTKLAPLVQDIGSLNTKVYAIQEELKFHVAENVKTQQIISEDIKDILKAIGDLKQYCHN